MNIIFLGSPGSGKGTQAAMVAKEMGFIHFSTGDLLRKIKDTDPEVSEIMKSGNMVPDSKVIDLTEAYLSEKNTYDNLIIDGSPRNLYQYQRLKDFFNKKGTSIDLAICINISDDEVIRRLTSRRTDKTTGKIYNLVTNPPGPEVNLNDLVQREDDSEMAVRQRLKVQKVSEELTSALKEDGVMFIVDGERPIAEIFNDIKQKIEGMRAK